MKYFKQSSLDALKANIDGNLKRYQSPTPWLDEVFVDVSYSLEADIPGAEGLELMLPVNGELYDLENTRRVYSALRHLDHAQAIDERLWAYMTHVYYWNYMRSRWPLEGKDRPSVFLRERYFFISNRDRALTRNGMARLWWYGYVSYDETKKDPFELTRLLLYTLDITASLLERSFSRNQSITRGVLEALAERQAQGDPIPDRETFRRAMKHLVLIGGVTILDSLDQEEVKERVLAELEEKNKAA